MKTEKIVLGIDKTHEIAKITLNKRVALVTNFTGVDSMWRQNYSVLLKAGCNIVKLMTPEHGLFGAAEGVHVENSTHEQTGLPIISLYGERRQPNDDDLHDVDIVLYDIQDVGLRYFTYIYTLANVIKACAMHGKELVVLDRPCPLGCENILGTRIKEEHSSFVGAYKLPIQYAMTAGEIGKYFIAQLGLLQKLQFSVVKMENYTRQMKFSDFDSPWNVPSPALIDYNSLLCYCGGCFFEATNISEGRGTPRPFSFYGAPYASGDAVVKELKNVINSDAFMFRERSFIPLYGKHKGNVCHGVEFFACNEKNGQFKPFLPIAVELMHIFAKMYPNDFALNKFADVSGLVRLTGDERIEEYVLGKIQSLDDMYRDFQKQQTEFYEQTRELYIYN